MFNADLKALLGLVIDYSSMGKVSSHSFRIGITTMLGKLGFCDQEIMAMGRWSSSAFELYIIMELVMQRLKIKEVWTLLEDDRKL